ncbi:predicted protein [Naegleria gruberi]|uniref:Predicted protein n=1 Tax=Naegleria gruberi TaxID=5762 RepID=D2VIQ4_NAEGR|nr:uncharacterized protein NAEGRDRAFT_68758 [Naegleria gruberi]EFC43315.1 predicted protein [Naegleria gruberi]|eukprot:XP_002676059.1 predicted protein [Naegleria gruberi strain NEG-M]
MSYSQSSNNSSNRGRGGGRGGYNNKGGGFSNNTPRPTHFFAVRINSPQTIKDLVEWQQSVLSEHDSHSEDYDLRDYLIEKERMHFTLFVLTLDTQDDLKDCITVFQKCQDELKNIVKNNLEGGKFSFKLSGVHTFEDKAFKKGRVVFTGPEFSHENGRQTFLDVSQYINDKLKENGLTVDKINNEIHCTLAKTSKVKKNNTPKSFPEYVYRHQKDTVFGDNEMITEVLLCRMKGPGSSDGFYHIEETVQI